jgi:hypothetical protein
MPAPAITAMAKKAGKSAAEAERLWSDSEEQAAKKKTKGTDEYYRYAMGIFKKMIGESAQPSAYRIVLEGDHVWLSLDGVLMQEGKDAEVDAVRAELQELLDKDVDAIYEMGGFTGTLQSIKEQAFRAWISYCVGAGSPVAVYAGKGRE